MRKFSKETVGTYANQRACLPEERAMMWRIYRAGYSIRDLARLFGRSNSVVVYNLKRDGHRLRGTARPEPNIVRKEGKWQWTNEAECLAFFREEENNGA